MQTVENYSGFPEPQKMSKASILNLSIYKSQQIISPHFGIIYFVQIPC